MTNLVAGSEHYHCQLDPIAFPFLPKMSHINCQQVRKNGETTCRQLSKRFPDNSTVFAAEATSITLALDYYKYLDPVKHDVVFYSDSMFCLQAIGGEDAQNPLMYHMNLL